MQSDHIHSAHREWLDARDVFLGRNWRAQDIGRGLAMARASQHPLCQRLAAIYCEMGDSALADKRLVLARLREEGDEDCELMLLRGWLAGFDEAVVQRAAEMGSARGAGLMAARGRGETKREWAERAMAGMDPQGFFEMSKYVREMGDEARADVLLRDAAELGWVQAQVDLASKEKNDAMKRMEWLCKCFRYNPRVMGEEVENLIEQLRKDEENAAKVLFYFGETHRDNVETAASWLPAKIREDAFRVWKENSSKTRDAVVCWILCARQLHVHKDVRRIITTMVWESRHEAPFVVEIAK